MRFRHTEHDSNIREAAARLCAGYPGACWRALARGRAYPDDFVAALTPEAYDSAGLPRSS